MLVSIRTLVFVTALSPAALAGADAAARLAGHWEGAIHAPVEDVVVAVDLAAEESGKLGGTFSTCRNGSAAFRCGARRSTARP